VTEYSPTDTQRFSRQRPHEQATRSLVVGRIARANWTKFHPDDPGLMRRIVGRGHVCRIMDGTLLKDALRDEAQSGQVELMPLDAMDARAFLEGLDCFLYWKHPLWVETGPNAILEAMAMELPVIVFGRDVGVAELIEHGRDGFLVETEEEALACLDRLADSPALRQSVGQAARRKVLAVLEKQEKHILDFYLKADRRRIPTPHSA
jgi:glycosyltransferase involved in cell wall biosynthesis